MIQRIILLFIFIYFSFSYAQTKLTVHYDFKANDDLVSMFPEFNNIENEIETLDLQLFIDKDKSLFFNANETKENEMAAIFARANTNLYYDLNTKSFLYNNPQRFYLKENEYLIQDNYLIEWDITTEQKLIMNYTAVKAISKTDKKTIAWFVPELPFAFGPHKFNNLPGLIVELQNQQGYYTMKKISFDNSIEINLPTKGNKITSKEFSQLQAEIEKEAKKYL